MPDDEPESDLAKLTNGLITVVEGMQPLVDAANGFKKKLEEDGWSPTAAETAALTLLVGMIQKSFS